MKHKDLKNSKGGILFQTLTSLFLIFLISAAVFYSRKIIQNAIQQNMEERTTSELLNLAEHETHHLEDLVDSTFQSLDAMASYLVITESLDLSVNSAYLNSYLQSRGYCMLGVSDLEGKSYCYTCKKEEELTDFFPDGEQVLQEGKHISNLHVTCGDSEMLAFAAPMIRDGEIVGAIYCGYPTSILSTIFTYPDFQTRDRIYVAHKSGMLLYSSTGGQLRYIPKSYLDLEDLTVCTPGDSLESIVEQMQRGGTGTFTVESQAVSDLLYLVYMPVENTDYYLLSLTDQTEAMEAFSSERSIIQHALMGILILYSLVSLTLMTLVFYRGLRRYSKVSVIVEEQKRQIDSLETELKDARIRNSLSQLEPHFLYNALGSIRQIVLEDPDYAADLIYDFTIFLRSCVRSLSSEEMIPFSQELENIRAYCNIEKMRFGDRLNIQVQTPVTDFSILPLTIQPLVENAIRHGICSRRRSKGTITIYTSMEVSSYVITVKDDGIGFDYDAYMQQMKSGEKDSTGLMNLRFRLENIMKGQMRIVSKEGEGTVVEVRIPRD